MSKQERLAKARKRVKEWKAAHPKSVQWQRQRWYQRQKAKRDELSFEPSTGPVLVADASDREPEASRQTHAESEPVAESDTIIHAVTDADGYSYAQPDTDGYAQCQSKP